MFNFSGTPNMNSIINSMGGMMGMMQQFNQFRSQLQGTPQQQALQAQNMIKNQMSNGQMSQDQFSYIFQLAQQFAQMMPK